MSFEAAIASKEKLPAGRTYTYQLYRICERFSQPASYVETLSRQDLIKLLAYNSIREQEETMMHQSMMSILIGSKGI